MDNFGPKATGRRSFPRARIVGSEEASSIVLTAIVSRSGSASAPVNILKQCVDGLDISQEFVRLSNRTLLACRM